MVAGLDVGDARREDDEHHHDEREDPDEPAPRRCGVRPPDRRNPGRRVRGARDGRSVRGATRPPVEPAAWWHGHAAAPVARDGPTVRRDHGDALRWPFTSAQSDMASELLPRFGTSPMSGTATGAPAGTMSPIAIARWVMRSGDASVLFL